MSKSKKKGGTEKAASGDEQLSYQVAKARSLEDLETRVSNLLRSGWKLHGPLMFIPDDHEPEYLQPMLHDPESPFWADGIPIAETLHSIWSRLDDLVTHITGKEGE